MEALCAPYVTRGQPRQALVRVLSDAASDIMGTSTKYSRPGEWQVACWCRVERAHGRWEMMGDRMLMDVWVLHIQYRVSQYLTVH